MKIAIQTWALLVDSYRELNSKKLFWITMALSGLVVAAFAAVGMNEKGLTLLWWEFEIDAFNTRVFKVDQFYKMIFVQFGIGFWLSWIASILALVSTASIFPDFIASGSIELTLSKPVSRLRLFLTKYMLGLLFVALQVAVFTASSFLVIGIRGGVWSWGLFWAVPLVVVFFSYLFAVCVLLGLLTRSTIASLLLTLLCWMMFFLANTADNIIVQFSTINEMRRESLPARIERATSATKTEWLKAERAKREREGQAGEPPEPTMEQLEEANSRLRQMREDLRTSERNASRWMTAQRVVYGIKTVFPKTQETIGILNRKLIEVTEMEKLAGDPDGDTNSPMRDIDPKKLQTRMEERMRSRSLWWVIGTSLVFEGVVLGIGAWVFARRDF